MCDGRKILPDISLFYFFCPSGSLTLVRLVYRVEGAKERERCSTFHRLDKTSLQISLINFGLVAFKGSILLEFSCWVTRTVKSKLDNIFCNIFI